MLTDNFQEGFDNFLIFFFFLQLSPQTLRASFSWHFPRNASIFTNFQTELTQLTQLIALTELAELTELTELTEFTELTELTVLTLLTLLTECVD